MKEKFNKIKNKSKKVKLAAAEIHVKRAAEEERAEDEKGKTGMEAETEMIDLCSAGDVHQKK